MTHEMFSFWFSVLFLITKVSSWKEMLRIQWSALWTALNWDSQFCENNIFHFQSWSSCNRSSWISMLQHAPYDALLLTSSNFGWRQNENSYQFSKWAPLQCVASHPDFPHHIRLLFYRMAFENLNKKIYCVNAEYTSQKYFTARAVQRTHKHFNRRYLCCKFEFPAGIFQFSSNFSCLFSKFSWRFSLRLMSVLRRFAA